ncbi:MAG: preprotein translocase subunit SecE [Lachnospiraceae bacterium]|nr:preprotein translocase subunit SecE [Lachnospiraceae bacterium]
MSDNEKAPKKSFFKGLKAEYRKIIWPSSQTVAKESGAVLVITIVLGAIIVVVDLLINFGLSKILGLSV